MIQNKIYRLFALIVVMATTWTGVSAAEAYKLTLAEGAETHGTVSFKVGETALTGETLTAEEGQTVTIAVACTGWTVSQITATASLDPTQMRVRTRSGDMPIIEEISLTKGDGNVWTMTMPAADVEIGIGYEEIQALAVQASWITIADGTYTYNGQAIEPTVTVKDGETDVTKKFTVSYSANVNAGDAATVTVTAKTIYPEYSGSVSKTFSIAPKAVTITAQDKAFTYTGEAQSWAQYDVTGLVGTDALTAVISGSITYPGESPVTNKVESYEFTSGTPGNYTVTTQDGQLTMTAASVAITITAASEEWTYDGIAHNNNTVTVTSGSLLEGDALVAAAAGSVTNVADTKTGNNPVAEGYKVMHGETDVTANYAITAVAGTLTVTPKAVTITAQDKAFTYTGEAQSWAQYDVTGLVGDDAITAVITGSITYPSQGTVANKVESYEFTSGTPGNYTVTTQDGELTMTNASVAITITAASGEWTYDGAAHTNTAVTVTSGSLLDGDALVAEATGSVTNVADTKAGNNPVAEGYKVMHGETDVTANYAITAVAGTLTVKPKAVTITAQDKAFTYTGAAQSWAQYDVAGLVGDDAITAVISGSITYPSQGTVANKVESYEFTSGTPGNYTVTTQDGQLTMTNATTMTVTATGFEGAYDGQAHGISVTAPEGAVIAYGTTEGTYDKDASPTYTNVGTYTVYYKVTKDNYDDVIGSATVTINKAAGSISYATVTVNKYYGDAVFTNALTKTGDGTVTYASNNESVATVDANGEVTIMGNGEATITATVADGTNYTYENKTASYLVSVGKTAMEVTANGYTGTYDGQAHGISVNAPDDATIAYGTTEGTYDKDASPTYTNAGTYTVFYLVTKKNYTDVTGSATVTINKADPVLTFSTTTATITFGNESAFVKPTLTTTPAGLSVTYESKNTAAATVNATTGDITPVAAGENIEIKATFAGNANYNSASTSYTLTVAKGSAAVSTAPTAKTLTYTGAAQELINAGEATGGTLVYAWDADGEFTTTIPTAINAGNYTVYYKVNGDANHNDVAVASIEVTIGKAAAVITKAPVAVANLINTGEAQALIVAGEATGGELQYKLGADGTYGTNVPTVTATGTYTVYYKVVGDANHNDVEEISIEVTAVFQERIDISGAEVTLNDVEYYYNMKEHKPEVISVVLNGKTLDKTDYEVSYQDNINAGTAKVVVTGQRAYTGEAVVAFTIQKAPVTITFSNREKTLNMNNQETYEQMPSVSLSGAVIKWSSSNTDVATVDYRGVVTPKGFGVVTITAYFIGDDNFAYAEGSYKLTVRNSFQLFVGGYEVTSDNRSDVMNNGELVKFDGRNNLLLKGVDIDGSIESGLENLTITLEGNNYLKSINGKGILTVTTDGNTPGSLVLDNIDGAVISGFSDYSYEQNLAVTSGSEGQNYIVISTPIIPLVDNPGDEHQVSMEGAHGINLSNTTIENVLYTLNEEYGDGVKDDYVNLSSVVVEEHDGFKTNFKPGTEEFAEDFAGLTIMVAAGTGEITVVAKTGAKGVLKVQIGNNEPMKFSGYEDFEAINIPYACEKATYVYIYNGSEADGAASRASRRISKKAHSTVGIRTIGVTATEVQESNNAAKSVEAQADSESIGKVVDDANMENHAEFHDEELSIDNNEVVSLEDDAFNSLLGEFISSIDLRSTNITGMTVCRTEGAFNGLSENTYIYMPAGNKSADGEVNIIFGKICPKAVLNVDMPADEYFSPATEFTAQQIELNRVFGEGEMATVYLPFDIDQTAAAMLGTFYTFDMVKNGYVKINEVTSGTLTAHTPYLFKAATDKISMRVVKVTPPAEEAGVRRLVPASGDGLFGSYKNMTSTTAYKLTGTDISDLKFQRMSSSDIIRPFEAYLSLSDETAASLTVTEDEGLITGIQDVNRKTITNNRVYDLQGRCVNVDVKVNVKKGIYIRQGKKIVIR